jgi:DNA-binding response OmpR family regulator
MTQENVDKRAEWTRALENSRDIADAHGHKVLVVEPDGALRQFLKRELGSYGVHVTACRDGEQALKELRSSHFDMVLQDIDLQGMDGMSLIHTVRAEFPQVAVMVLTRRSHTEDMVQALDRGAQDYMVKPFSLRELLARIRALLRRSPAAQMQAPASPTTLSLSKADRRVKRGERQIDLTPREFALLERLVEHKGEAVSRSTLMQEVWNAPLDPSTNIIDVYMKYLRDKIDRTGERKLIRTIRGVGYMLDPSSVVFA